MDMKVNKRLQGIQYLNLALVVLIPIEFFLIDLFDPFVFLLAITLLLLPVQVFQSWRLGQALKKSQNQNVLLTTLVGMGMSSLFSILLGFIFLPLLPFFLFLCYPLQVVLLVLIRMIRSDFAFPRLESAYALRLQRLTLYHCSLSILGLVSLVSIFLLSLLIKVGVKVASNFLVSTLLFFPFAVLIQLLDIPFLVTWSWTLVKSKREGQPIQVKAWHWLVRSNFAIPLIAFLFIRFCFSDIGILILFPSLLFAGHLISSGLLISGWASLVYGRRKETVIREFGKLEAAPEEQSQNEFNGKVWGKLEAIPRYIQQIEIQEPRSSFLKRPLSDQSKKRLVCTSLTLLALLLLSVYFIISPSSPLFSRSFQGISVLLYGILLIYFLLLALYLYKIPSANKEKKVYEDRAALSFLLGCLIFVAAFSHLALMILAWSIALWGLGCSNLYQSSKEDLYPSTSRDHQKKLINLSEFHYNFSLLFSVLILLSFFLTSLDNSSGGAVALYMFILLFPQIACYFVVWIIWLISWTIQVSKQRKEFPIKTTNTWFFVGSPLLFLLVLLFDVRYSVLLPYLFILADGLVSNFLIHRGWKQVKDK